MGVQLVGQRAYFVSGWEPKTAVPVGEYVILDMEMESERLRRLEDEFCARLERDRWVLGVQCLIRTRDLHSTSPSDWQKITNDV